MAHGYDAIDDETRGPLPDIDEVDVTIDYRPQSGPLSGLWLRIRYAHAEFSDNTTRRNFRMIVNYALPML